MNESTLVRLPPHISDAINGAVEDFIDQNFQDGIRGHLRWHGADLWMVYSNRNNGEKTYRVVIGAYSDDPDTILFMPDFVVTKPEGRYILPPERRVITDSETKLSVLSLVFHQLRYQKIDDSPIRYSLMKAWQHALSFSVEDASVLLDAPLI